MSYYGYHGRKTKSDAVLPAQKALCGSLFTQLADVEVDKLHGIDAMTPAGNIAFRHHQAKHWKQQRSTMTLRAYTSNKAQSFEFEKILFPAEGYAVNFYLITYSGTNAYVDGAAPFEGWKVIDVDALRRDLLTRLKVTTEGKVTLRQFEKAMPPGVACHLETRVDSSGNLTNRFFRINSDLWEIESSENWWHNGNCWAPKI